MHFSLRLQDLIWTLELGCYLGEVRRVGANIYQGSSMCWACAHIISYFCYLPGEECIITSIVLKRRPVAVGSQSHQGVDHSVWLWTEARWRKGPRMLTFLYALNPYGLFFCCNWGSQNFLFPFFYWLVFLLISLPISNLRKLVSRWDLPVFTVNTGAAT